MTPEEAGEALARSLPPLTDAEVAQVAALLVLPVVRGGRHGDQ